MAKAAAVAAGHAPAKTKRVIERLQKKTGQPTGLFLLPAAKIGKRRAEKAEQPKHKDDQPGGNAGRL